MDAERERKRQIEIDEALQKRQERQERKRQIERQEALQARHNTSITAFDYQN